VNSAISQIATSMARFGLFPEAWSAASGRKVDELMASWTEQMGSLE